MPATLTLGKNERLKSRKLIGRVFGEGKRLQQGCLRIHFLFTGSPVNDQNLQLGVTVSSKNFRRAVDRNRVKRLLREAWRLEKNILQDQLETRGQLLVFIVYTAKDIVSFGIVREDIRLLVSKLTTLIKKQG